MRTATSRILGTYGFIWNNKIGDAFIANVSAIKKLLIGTLELIKPVLESKIEFDYC